MASSLARQIFNINVPVFGTLGLVGLVARNSARAIPLFAPWAFPVAVGGTWFMWYFLDDDLKRDMGLMRRLPPTPPPTPSGGPPKLDSTASAAVMNAYKEGEHELTDKQKKIKEEIAKGDFTTLREVWETKMGKRIIPGDDDDEEEEEEEEDEEEEAEEEEEEV